MVLAYNCFVQDNGKGVIDKDAPQHCRERRVSQHLNEWVMLSQGKFYSGAGKSLRREARYWPCSKPTILFHSSSSP